MTTKELCDIFKWGVDYGLFIAEGERDSEDMFDAAGCAVYSAKHNVPSTCALRRQPHSDAWRQAKKGALISFIDFVAAVAPELVKEEA